MSAGRDDEPPRPGRLLVVVAHPGDGEDGIDARVRDWVEAGTVAHLACGTSGELSGADPAADPLEVAARQEAAQRSSADAAGYEAVTFLHRPHGALVNDLATREQLVRVIRGFRPDTLATFDPRVVIGADGEIAHVDHREVGQAALDAVEPAATPMAFRQLSRSDGLEPHAVARLLLFSGLDITLRLHREG